jgi:hypothetical protein
MIKTINGKLCSIFTSHHLQKYGYDKPLKGLLPEGYRPIDGDNTPVHRKWNELKKCYVYGVEVEEV